MNTMTINAGTVAGTIESSNELVKVNQDSFAYVQENGYTVIASADGNSQFGNGSALGSSIAAATAVEEVLDSLISGHNIDEALRKGVFSAREVLLSRDDHKTLGCTLSVAAVTEDQWGVALVGDAFAVISEDFENHKLIHEKNRRDFQETVSVSLLTDDIFDPFFVYGEGEIKAVSVATDGLTDVAVGKDFKDADYDFWVPVVQKALEQDFSVERFLEALSQSGNIQDDATLVVAVR